MKKRWQRNLMRMVRVGEADLGPPLAQDPGSGQKSLLPMKRGLGFYVLWYLLRLLANLSQGGMQFVVRKATFVRCLVAKKNKQILMRNIEMLWGLPRHTSFAQSFSKQVLSKQITIALETLKAIFKPHLLIVEGLADLEQNLRQQEAFGRGQVVITGHVGSWELAGALCARSGTCSFFALAKPARYGFLTLVLDQLRRKMGLGVLWTGGKTLPRQMQAVLQKGASLGFVMDQKPAERQGAEVKFFDRETPFVNGPAAMVIRGQRPLVAVFCVRLGYMHYRAYSRVLLPAEHGETNPQKVTQLMASEIEKIVRLYPEQWCWDYRRWIF